MSSICGKPLSLQGMERMLSAAAKMSAKHRERREVDVNVPRIVRISGLLKDEGLKLIQTSQDLLSCLTPHSNVKELVVA